ncbi:MAG: hypothetical protein COA33_006095 [Fluviicola sp.]|nr:hypothetical protein [Fluviicola sp.]
MKLKEGDIFTIPINNQFIGLGQIIYMPNKKNYMIIVFKERYEVSSVPLDLFTVSQGDIFLMGYTVDAKFYHKHWKVIGNVEVNLGRIRLPYFKLGIIEKEMLVINYQGKEIGQATKEDLKLNYKTVIAPVRFENALKYLYNEREWNSSFNEILYSTDLLPPLTREDID